MWPPSFLMKMLLENGGVKEIVCPKCRMQVRNSSACWEIIPIFLRGHMLDHINDVSLHSSCHLIALTLCLAQKSLIWIALYWNRIHIYNVGQLQLNFKLHCGKLCPSTTVYALKFLLSAVSSELVWILLAVQREMCSKLPSSLSA